MALAQRSTADTLNERTDFLISEMLTRYSNIIKLAPNPSGEVTKEIVAQQSFQMKVETAALVSAAEGLLKLGREMKLLWLAGPLRDVGEGESNPEMDANAKKVQDLIEQILIKPNGKDMDMLMGTPTLEI